MKKYKCREVVEASKIVAVMQRGFSGGAWIDTDDRDTHTVDSLWLIKHNPRVGGYLVRYQDGYLSFSPTKAFEDGYTELVE